MKAKIGDKVKTDGKIYFSDAPAWDIGCVVEIWDFDDMEIDYRIAPWRKRLYCLTNDCENGDCVVDCHAFKAHEFEVLDEI